MAALWVGSLSGARDDPSGETAEDGQNHVDCHDRYEHSLTVLAYVCHAERWPSANIPAIKFYETVG